MPPPAAPLAHATFGHLHLSVSALEPARKFYTGELGLAIRQDTYPEALFLAADEYHHHIAVNTWGHPAPRGPARLTGLAGFSAASRRTTAPRTLTDPDGTSVTLEPLAGP